MQTVQPFSEKIKKQIIRDLKRFKKQDSDTYCFVWDWEAQGVYPYILADYAMEIQSIQNSSIVKHKDFYLEKPLIIDNKEYYVRMESYGHSKPNKLLIGINPLALSFNVLLFDYVYVYLELEEDAIEKMIELIKKLIQREKFKQAELLITQLGKIFKKQKSVNKLSKELEQAKAEYNKAQLNEKNLIINMKCLPSEKQLQSIIKPSIFSETDNSNSKSNSSLKKETLQKDGKNKSHNEKVLQKKSKKIKKQQSIKKKQSNLKEQ